jgi:hypothetical protein
LFDRARIEGDRRDGASIDAFSTLLSAIVMSMPSAWDAAARSMSPRHIGNVARPRVPVFYCDSHLLHSELVGILRHVPPKSPRLERD